MYHDDDLRKMGIVIETIDLEDPWPDVPCGKTRNPLLEHIARILRNLDDSLRALDKDAQDGPEPWILQQKALLDIRRLLRNTAACDGYGTDEQKAMGL